MRNATLRAARALASGAIAAALVSAAATASAAQIDPRLRAAADSFAAPSGGPQTAWADLSDESRLRAERRQDMLVEAVRRIPRAELKTPAELLLHDNLSEIVEARRGTRVCRAHLWAGTSQFGGWHVAASNAARVQRVGTPETRDSALARFALLPAAMRAEQAMLVRGRDSGYTQSRAVIDAVVRQLDDLLPTDPSASPLWSPAARDSTAEFQAAWRALLADSIYPAARRYREFLVSEYAPKARASGSMSGLPDGMACYKADLRSRTSVDADLASMMRDARAEYARLAARLAPISEKLTGERDLGKAIIALRSDPRFTFPLRDSILPAYRAMTKLAEARFPRVVANFRPESLAVLPYPAFQERAGLPPQYLRASDDRARPAQFMVNLSRTERMSVANAVAHEGYPGHHLQIIAAAQATPVHPVMRQLSVGGFIEGWGIYSEDLADEMGLYTTALDSAGALVHLIDVAMGYYLDIGHHVRGWSRQDLIDSMVVLGGRMPPMAAAYADRHSGTPGQLATYFVGYQAILDARRRAEQALGAAFSSPEFHYEALRDGPITLKSFREKMERWVESRRTATR